MGGRARRLALGVLAIAGAALGSPAPGWARDPEVLTPEPYDAAFPPSPPPLLRPTPSPAVQTPQPVLAPPNAVQLLPRATALPIGGPALTGVQEGVWRELAPATARRPPARTPGLANGPWRFEARVGAAQAVLNERYPRGGIGLVPQAIERYELAAAAIAPGWRFDANLSYMGYTIQDRQLAASRHHRDQFGGSIATGPEVALGAATLSLQLLYWGRQVSVAHSLPPPQSTPFVSSVSQLFHGPGAGLGLALPLGGPWHLDLKADVRPYVLAVGDEAVLELAPLYGYALAPAIGWDAAPGMRWQAGYRLESLAAYSADFIHNSQGPFVAVNGRF